MLKGSGSLTENLKIAKEAGFKGVELELPGNNVAEAKKAGDVR